MSLISALDAHTDLAYMFTWEITRELWNWLGFGSLALGAGHLLRGAGL